MLNISKFNIIKFTERTNEQTNPEPNDISFNYDPLLIFKALHVTHQISHRQAENNIKRNSRTFSQINAQLTIRFELPPHFN